MEAPKPPTRSPQKAQKTPWAPGRRRPGHGSLAKRWPWAAPAQTHAQDALFFFFFGGGGPKP